MKSPGEASFPTGSTIYRFNGVPVVARPGFWPYPFLLTGLLARVAGQGSRRERDG